MMSDTLVTISKRLYDHLLLHCKCEDFDKRLNIPGDKLNAKKRKTKHRSGPQLGEGTIAEPGQLLSTEPLPINAHVSELSQHGSQDIGTEISESSQQQPSQQLGSETSQESRPEKIGPADRLIRNASNAKEWRTRQIELGLMTAEEYEKVIKALTSQSSVGFRDEPYEHGQSENQLVLIGKRLALVAKSSLANMKLQRSFANFQILILLSYCEFLRRRGVPDDTTDGIIQLFTDMRQIDRRRLLDSISWINGRIVDLVRNGWSIYRATELFFLYAPSISDLVKIRDGTKSKSILTHFTAATFVTYDYGDCLSPSYTIPSLILPLVQSVATDIISINELFAALGYDLESLPQSMGKVYTVQAASRNASITPINLDFEVVTKNSFSQSQRPPGAWKQSEHVIQELCRRTAGLNPPQALLVYENLFHNIKIYFKNSCRNMRFDDHGILLTPNGAKLYNDLCNNFDSYCFTATILIEKGLHVEFRHALSKASALVKQILQAEHPRTLACFLEVFIHLIQTGLPEVTSFLLDFIKEMSAKVTRKGHPWGQICRLLGELNSESLDQAMAQTWKCITDTFDSELGMFSPLAVSVRLDYIKRVYGITNHLEEERLLRELLAHFGDIPSPRVMLNLAHNLNRQGCHDEAEEMAQEVLLLLQKYEIYATRIVERIESLKIISHSQFNQGKTLAAEQTMREALKMIVDQWGKQHSWVLEFMNVLEGWLRGWGQEEDANTLRGEIEELMGKDEIDKQLDGVQDLLC